METSTGPTTVRRSEAEFRRHVLNTAQEMVDELGGLKVTVDDLSFEKVIERSQVSRSTAYRYWPSLEQFHDDVLLELAGRTWNGTAAFDPETISMVTELVGSNIAKLVTAEGRRGLFREGVRIGVARNFAAVCRSAEWRTYVALTATLLSYPKDSEAHCRTSAALRRSESRFLDYMTEFYQDMAIVLGFRARHPDGLELLAGAGAAVLEGLALRQILTPDLIGRVLTVEGPDGAEEWGLPALCFLAVADSLVEPLPDYDPTNALAEYFNRVSRRRLTPSERLS